MFDRKLRYKMYKSGKQWCCAALATLTAVLGITLTTMNVSADTVASSTASTIQTTKKATTTDSKVTDPQNIDGSSLKQNNDQTTTDTNTTESVASTVTNPTTVTDSTNNNVISTQNGDVNEIKAQNTATKTTTTQASNSQVTMNTNSATGWQTTKDGQKYYVNVDGTKATGKTIIDNKTYYFDPANNDYMSTKKFLEDENNSTYYFGENGQMYQDQFYSNWGYTYYFQKDGSRLDDGFYTNWGKTYYFGDGGVRLDNAFYVNWGHAYWFQNDGSLAVDTVVHTSNGDFHADINGILTLHDQFIYSLGNVYYFNNDGQMIKGQFYTNWGHQYYFKDDGSRATSEKVIINGSTYYFDQNGIMKTNYLMEQNGKVYYFGSDGARWDNKWMTYYGNQYYFKDDGARATNEVLTIDGKNYYFDNDGIQKKNYLLKQNGKTYYFGDDGVQYVNQFYTSNGDRYFFGDDGAMKTGTFTYQDVQYTTDENGVIQSSKQITADATQNKFATTNAEVQAQRNKIAKGIAEGLSKAGKGSVDYDWNNQNDNFDAFSMHDTAQLIAMSQKNALAKAAGDTVEGNQGLEADSTQIEKNLAQNALLNGTVETIFTNSYIVNGFGNENDYVNQVVKDFMNQINLNNVDGDILGVGSSYYAKTNHLVVTGILFKKGDALAPKTQATSTIANPIITHVWGNGNKVVTNGLSVNDTVDDAELNHVLSDISSAILTGNAGETIPTNILQLYYDAIVGAESTTGISGQRAYKGTDGKTYHYVYWLEDAQGNNKNKQWDIFMNANKGVKYGEPIKFNFQATLTEGAPAAQPVSNKPTAAMSKDEINMAFATGSDTGLSHDAVKIEKINNYDESLARGVDLGSLMALERAGVKFYDFNGKQADLFDILQDAGINYVRMRVWNDPYDAANNSYGGGNTDEASLIALAKRAKAHNMKILMDFHYSDFWADPATQYIPKAWQDEDQDTMEQEVYDYTKKVLLDLRATGVEVGIVQIGNEITKGILTQQTSSDFWTTDSTASVGATYLKAGIKAAREVFPNATVALHLEGTNQSNYRNIMNAWKKYGLDYDALSTSYYPFWVWSNNQYSVQDIFNGVVNMVQNEFNKKVVISEISWPSTVNDTDGTNNTASTAGSANYQIGVQGQVDAMRDAYQNMSNQNGEIMGAFWWEPAWIAAKPGYNYKQYNIDAGDALGTGWASAASLGYYADSKLYWQNNPTWGGTSWDNQTWFDDQGHPTEALKMFKGFKDGYKSTDYDAQQKIGQPDVDPTKLATSTLTPKVSNVIYSDGIDKNVKINNGLSVNDTLDIDSLITDAAKKKLAGDKTQVIGDSGLSEILANMKDGISTKSYQDTDGNTYHYVLNLEGANAADQERDFDNTNAGKKYGENLTIHYTATLVFDKYSSNAKPTGETVTSPVTIQINDAWNDDGDVPNPIDKGATVSLNDVSTVVNDKVKKLLTGPEGSNIDTETLNQIADALPGVNEALIGTRTYTDANGKKYHYEYWLEGQSLSDKEWQLNNANKSAKYGNTIVLPYSATLKAD